MPGSQQTPTIKAIWHNLIPPLSSVTLPFLRSSVLVLVSSQGEGGWGVRTPPLRRLRGCVAKCGQLPAHLPEPARGLAVIRGARRADGPAVGEVAAAHALYLRRGGEVDRGLGAALRADSERATEREGEIPETCLAVAEVAGDEAGMQRVGRHPGSVQLPRQLIREEDIGELRFAVDAEGEVAAAVLHIVEGNVGAGMHGGGDGDDAGGRAGFQRLEQQVGQQERREVIERERHLNAVRRLAAAPEEDRAGVVDEHVQAVVACTELLSRPAHLRLHTEIGDQRADVVIAGLFLDTGDHRLRLGGIAREQDHVGPALGQRPRRHQPDPRGRARHQADTPLHLPSHSPLPHAPPSSWPFSWCLSRPIPFRILAEACRETPGPMETAGSNSVRRGEACLARPAVAYWTHLAHLSVSPLYPQSAT